MWPVGGLRRRRSAIAVNIEGPAGARGSQKGSTVTITENTAVEAEAPVATGSIRTGIHVTKRDGTREPYNADRINKAIERAAAGLPDQISMTTQIATELELTLFDGITTQQLDEAVIQVAAPERQGRPDVRHRRRAPPAQDHLQARARRLRDRATSSSSLHAGHFPGYIERGVAETAARPAPRPTLFDLDALAAALEPTRDDLLKYIGVVTLQQPLRHQGAATATPLEVPQFFWMRIAMGLVAQRGRPDQPRARVLRQDVEARVPRRRLHAGQRGHRRTRSSPTASSWRCRTTSSTSPRASRDVMWLTKGTGGIGLSVTKLRSQGSPIRSNNTTSTGPDPVHAHDRLDAARGQPRRQEVRRAVLLHGELAPRLPASSSTCARTPATRTAAPAPRTPPCGSATSS